MIRLSWTALLLLALPASAIQRRTAGPPKAPIPKLPAPAAGLPAPAAGSAAASKPGSPASAGPPAAAPAAAGSTAAAPAAPQLDFDGGKPDPAKLAAEVFADADAGRSPPLSVRKYDLLRWLERPLFWAVMRPKFYGRDNIPSGPAGFLFNHASFGPDPVSIIHGADRPMRFMIKRSVYEAQTIKAKLRSGKARFWERPFLELMARLSPRLYRQLGAVPIAKQDPPALKEASLEILRQALRDGQSVAVFPEGVITRSGTLGGFRNGFARVFQAVPGTRVVPGYLDGLWGTRLSRRYLPKGSYLKDLLPRFRVFYGAPLAELTPQAARQAVSELSATAMETRLREERAPLAFELARRAKRRGARLAVTDAAGVRLTYRAFAAEAALLSVRLDEKLAENEPTGILLPPSADGAIANAALAAAGRVVVNLDPANAPAAAAAAGIRTIVTTRGHLSSLRQQGVGLPADASWLFLDDERAALTDGARRRRELALRLLPASLWARLFFARPARDMDATAAVLFTSGSGGKPEAVEVSHLNVLASSEMAREVLPAARDDTVLGVLPFSNPFGFSTTLWMPLLSGMTAAYQPDPFDFRRVGALASRAAATLLFATPRLLGLYAAYVTPGDFKSLRLVVAGAEKLHASLSDRFSARFGLRPVEAYGTTELTGVAAVSVPEPTTGPAPSLVDPGMPDTVGRNLPGSAARVVNPSTGELVREGDVGLLEIKGPHVMKGYRGKPERTAAAIRDGWYRTSDLAAMSRDGRITIVGPKARFTLIGDEVVSHDAVEERLRQASGSPLADFAVTSVSGGDGRPRLVALHSGWRGDVEALKAAALSAGLSPAAVPSVFKRVLSIPTTSSGRLDLAALNRLAKRP